MEKMKNVWSKTQVKMQMACGKGIRLINFMKGKLWILSMLMYAFLAPSNMVYATAAQDKWNTLIGFVLPWISRLGGVILLIGAVEFGIAFKGDDAEGKTKGMRTAIAGCIVIAIGLSAGTFLYDTTPKEPVLEETE